VPDYPELTGGVVTTSPSQAAFGLVAVGNSADIRITLTSSGGRAVGTVWGGCGDIKVVPGVNYNLTGGESTTFLVRFTPTRVGWAKCKLWIPGPEGGLLEFRCTGFGVVADEGASS